MAEKKPISIVTPLQNNAPVDSAGIFSRLWYLYFGALTDAVMELAGRTVTAASGLVDAVIGAPALIHSGKIPKVDTAGKLKESAIDDDGTKVTLRRAIAAGVQPMLVIDDTVGPSKGRLGKFERTGLPDRLDLSINLTYDGTHYNLDDITKGGALLLMEPTGFAFYTATASPGPANPAILQLAGQVAGTAFDAVASYEVAGTQVVGARLAAVTAPTGGGTAVANPSGGSVIDVQARNAIATLIGIVGASGNTVDPVARASIGTLITRLQTHGLTA